LKEFPRKVFRPADEQLSDLRGKIEGLGEGRTIYLRLDAPIVKTVDGRERTIGVLRFKGVRPAFGLTGKLRPYSGWGYVPHKQVIRAEGSGASLTVEKNALEPAGVMTLAGARREIETARALAAAGLSTDAPLGLGVYPHVFNGEKTAMTVFGMEGDDYRLYALATLPTVRANDKMIPDRGEERADVAEAAAVFRAWGRTARQMHRAGYAHRYLYDGNMGVNVSGGEWKLSPRDLETAVSLKDSSVEESAGLRFLDMSRPFYDTLKGFLQAERSTIYAADARLRNYLEGYFDKELTPAKLEEFEALDDEAQNPRLAELLVALDSADGVERIELARSFPQIWKWLREAAANDAALFEALKPRPGFSSRTPDEDPVAAVRRQFGAYDAAMRAEGFPLDERLSGLSLDALMKLHALTESFLAGVATLMRGGEEPPAVKIDVMTARRRRERIVDALKAAPFDDAAKKELTTYLNAPGLIRQDGQGIRVETSWSLAPRARTAGISWVGVSSPIEILLLARPVYRRSLAVLLERMKALGFDKAGEDTAAEVIKGMGLEPRLSGLTVDRMGRWQIEQALRKAAAISGLDIKGPLVLQHNLVRVAAEDFEEVATKESIGGNAGEGYIGVNMALNPDGRIAAVGNNVVGTGQAGAGLKVPWDRYGTGRYGFYLGDEPLNPAQLQAIQELVGILNAFLAEDRRSGLEGVADWRMLQDFLKREMGQAEWEAAMTLLQEVRAGRASPESLPEGKGTAWEGLRAKADALLREEKGVSGTQSALSPLARRILTGMLPLKVFLILLGTMGTALASNGPSAVSFLLPGALFFAPLIALGVFAWRAGSRRAAARAAASSAAPAAEAPVVLSPEARQVADIREGVPPRQLTFDARPRFAMTPEAKAGMEKGDRAGLTAAAVWALKNPLAVLKDAAAFRSALWRAAAGARVDLGGDDVLVANVAGYLDADRTAEERLALEGVLLRAARSLESNPRARIVLLDAAGRDVDALAAALPELTALRSDNRVIVRKGSAGASAVPLRGAQADVPEVLSQEGLEGRRVLPVEFTDGTLYLPAGLRLLAHLVLKKLSEAIGADVRAAVLAAIQA
jgi:hypothetical protein